MKNLFKPFILAGIICSLIISNCTSVQEPWTDLITENRTEDFIQLGGKAIYSIENGTITGTTVAHTENSFLCTPKQYADFILEFKVLVDTALNSGVQIRSHAFQNGRVYGYQVEIDPSTRAYSGGIYDEARRGWLQDLSGNEAGRNAFRNDKWNQYRIEAIGNSITTWINGIMCANLVDEADDAGFIAFQVHGINADAKPWTEGVHVKWKDIRILTSDLESHIKIEKKDPVPEKITLLNNRLTDAELEEGWEMLFDGESMDKWRDAQKDAIPGKGWRVEDGILTLHSKVLGMSAKAGDIVTREKYSDFELNVDFKLTAGANSGIKYFVAEMKKAQGLTIGLEYQLLDDDSFTGEEHGRDGNRTVASLYDLIPARNKYAAEIGTWNIARIVSKNRKVEHWLNGRKVLEYERGSEEFRKLVAVSKYNEYDNFGEAEEGHILLQDHPGEVAFRNIKIRRLTGN